MAGVNRNPRPASIGTGGRLRSESPADFVGMRSFTVVRVVGSHYQLFNETTRRHTTVPHHNRDLPRGTVSAIIQQAGLTRDEFLGLL